MQHSASRDFTQNSCNCITIHARHSVAQSTDGTAANKDMCWPAIGLMQVHPILDMAAEAELAALKNAAADQAIALAKAKVAAGLRNVVQQSKGRVKT